MLICSKLKLNLVSCCCCCFGCSGSCGSWPEPWVILKFGVWCCWLVLTALLLVLVVVTDSLSSTRFVARTKSSLFSCVDVLFRSVTIFWVLTVAVSRRILEASITLASALDESNVLNETWSLIGLSVSWCRFLWICVCFWIYTTN